MKAKAMLAQAGRLGYRARIESVLAYVAEAPEIEIPPDAFDAVPSALHCSNGVVVLGPDGASFRRPSRRDYATFNTGVRYAPDAHSELLADYFKRFLPDLELRGYAQELLGSALLGGNEHRMILFIVGGTSSGKTTLGGLISAALGDYARVFNMTIFRDHADERARTDIADALPARVIIAEETGNRTTIDADAIKRLTGGSPISVRRNYAKKTWQQKPSFVPIVLTNHPPKILGVDPAVERRLFVLPMSMTIPSGEEVIGRRDEMESSIEVRGAFLGWLIEGYSRYRQRGCLPEAPTEVLLAKSDLRDGVSGTSEFRAMCCEYGPASDPNYEMLTNDLYEVYRAWHCRYGATGAKALSLAEFSTELDSVAGVSSGRPRGITFGVPGSRDSKVRTKKGIRLTEEWRNWALSEAIRLHEK